MASGYDLYERSPIRIADVHAGSEAWIAPQIGFNCFRFQTRVNRQLIDLFDVCEDFVQGSHRPSSAGCPILFPYPNRVEQGTFVWDNRRFELPASKLLYDSHGNAIHGLCLDRPWRILDRTENSICGVFQLSVDAPERLSFWPSDFILAVTYRLIDNRLAMDFEIENPGDDPLPWGLGLHPYFRIPLNSTSNDKHCLIEVPVENQWELDANIPRGIFNDETCELPEGAYFDLLELDDLFSIEASGRPFYQSSIIDEHAGLQMTLTCQNNFRFFVIYTPSHRGSICLEPYTCQTNAINLQNAGFDTGLQTLQPGEKHILQVSIEAGEIYV